MPLMHTVSPMCARAHARACMRACTRTAHIPSIHGLHPRYVPRIWDFYHGRRSLLQANACTLCPHAPSPRLCKTRTPARTQVNTLDEAVELWWFHDGGEVFNGLIEAGSNLYVGTFTFHQVDADGAGAACSPGGRPCVCVGSDMLQPTHT